MKNGALLLNLADHSTHLNMMKPALHYLQRRSILFLIAMLFIGTPDGVEIINLTASILMAIALIPYGYKLIANK